MKRAQRVKATRANLTQYQRSVSLESWELAMDTVLMALEKSLPRVVEQVVDELLTDDGTYICFPITQYPDDGRNQKAPADPLTAEICLADGSPDGAVYRFQLGRALELELESSRAGDESYVEGLTKLRDAFRSLADEIDVAITHATSTAARAAK